LKSEFDLIQNTEIKLSLMLKNFSKQFVQPFHCSSLLYKRTFSTTSQGMNVLFFGTDIIAKTVLEALHKNALHQFKNPVVKDLAVVTSPDIIGKKNQQPVKLYCEQKKIPHYQPLSKNKDNHQNEWNSFIEQTIGSQKFDFGVACSFGYMIPDNIIDLFPKGMVVIHPSLLPRYRGASPLQYTLLNGDEEAGVSILEISKGKFDAGKIYIQEKIPVQPTTRYTELGLELAVLGGNRIIDLIENLDYYKENGILQSESSYKKSSAKKFDVEHTFISFKELSNNEVFNRYRAFYGTGYTTVRTKFQDGWFFIDEMGVVPQAGEEETMLGEYPNAVAGSIWLLKAKKYKNNLYVKCKDGWVSIRGGYMESTKPQPSYKFIEKFINKEEVFADKNSEGRYHFN